MARVASLHSPEFTTFDLDRIFRSQGEIILSKTPNSRLWTTQDGPSAVNDAKAVTAEIYYCRWELTEAKSDLDFWSAQLKFVDEHLAMVGRSIWRLSELKDEAERRITVLNDEQKALSERIQLLEELMHR